MDSKRLCSWLWMSLTVRMASKGDCCKAFTDMMRLEIWLEICAFLMISVKTSTSMELPGGAITGMGVLILSSSMIDGLPLLCTICFSKQYTAHHNQLRVNISASGRFHDRELARCNPFAKAS